MGRLSNKLRNALDGNGGRMLFWYCYGCDEAHAVTLDYPMSGPNTGPWRWDGNVEAPTFAPSVNVRPAGRDPQRPQDRGRCHQVITSGMVSFCADTQHALAGQTIPMPDLPEWLR